MNDSIRRKLTNRKRRIQRRLRDRVWHDQMDPMFAASNIHYDIAERDRGLSVGGIGMMHLLARRTGLVKAIDNAVELLKVHLPYHESDHVLNIAYNILAGGSCLEDIELRRNDEVYLDALGAQRIDLYFAGPAAFAVALGHRWNALPPTQVHEFVATERRYVPTLLIG